MVFASTGYGGGCVLLRPKRKADGKFSVEQVWKSSLLDNHHGSVVLLDGNLYGAGHESRGWFCLDFKTGGKLWQSPGKGSLTYADRRLYCLDEKGTMSLIGAAGNIPYAPRRQGALLGASGNLRRPAIRATFRATLRIRREQRLIRLFSNYRM